MKTTTITLTKSQIEIYISLLRLGDSKEVALKTVLELKQADASLYTFAYTN